MAGALLLGLKDILQLGPHRRLHFLSLMAHDQHHPLRPGLLRGFDGPAQEGLPEERMQPLRRFRLHAGALPGGEDERGDLN